MKQTNEENHRDGREIKEQAKALRLQERKELAKQLVDFATNGTCVYEHE